MSAQRFPVLRQIDPTYGVYNREVYLPQLTSGPSSVAWLPDSQAVVFSMQGSLWRQSLNSTTAEQLTGGPGYDYQPDVSSDGRWVIYSKYDHDAIELWLLDLTTRQNKPLTKNGSVNLEPRWSPAFKSGDARIAFVSTQFNQHFHIFVAQFDAAKQELKEVQRLTEERRSTRPRPYDSSYDHEIGPAWSPDGKEIIFVSNHNRSDGAGGFWRMKSTPVLVEAPPPVPRGPFGMMARRLPPIVKEDSRQIYDAKTTWRARPEWSPDGKRVLYAAYQWSVEGGEHQLSVITPEGKDPALLPHSSQGYDDFNPRWSPDGKSIALISNRNGRISLWMQDAAGGSQREIVQKIRKFLAPMATIRLQGQGGDANGGTGSVRVSVTAADGRAYAPDHALIYADDSFDRAEHPFEVHYFDLNISRLRPSEEIVVPAGKVHIEVMHGLETLPANMDVEVKEDEAKVIPFTLHALRLRDNPAVRWTGADTHVRINYGGAYHSTPQTLLQQMAAEDLSVAYELMPSEEEVSPARASVMAGKVDPMSSARHHILYGEEFHSSFWGDLAALNTNAPLSWRFFSFPNRPPSIMPTNANISDLARTRNDKALVGYAHPFSQIPDPDSDAKLTNELPIDVALGKVDYYEVLGDSDAKASAAVWYKLLNLGFRLPAAAGSDAVTGCASIRGPVGLDRVYVRTPAGPFKIETWLDGFKHGRSFATNGPLLRFTLGGQPIGGELKLPAPKSVKFTASLRSIVPVDHLEVVCNGEVAINVPMNRTHDASDAIGALHLARSGWCLLRAWAEKAEGPILDSYPYATTNPIYVTVGNAKPKSPDDAKYFLAWVDHVMDNAKASTEYKNEAQKTDVLKTIEAAHTVYDKLAK
ncbi:MAG TPA: CehA/McbA family metallohydrolase [Terriglobales bacterium]|jgi:TolB protein|nr:CehA/McbA family metallohydrolase [Terriglobales bacterium]